MSIRSISALADTLVPATAKIKCIDSDEDVHFKVQKYICGYEIKHNFHDIIVYCPRKDVVSKILWKLIKTVFTGALVAFIWTFLEN